MGDWINGWDVERLSGELVLRRGIHAVILDMDREMDRGMGHRGCV